MPTTPDNAPIRRIVVGVDDRHGTIETLEWAVGEAQLRRAAIVLVHAAGCEVMDDVDGAARDLGALIVIGCRSSRDHHTLDGLDCPVVEVGPSGRSDSRVLVVADGTAWSLRAVELGFEEAVLRGLPLTVVHSLPDPGPGSSDLDLMDEAARIEAASGPSELGFQRAILQQQVHDLQHRFAGVRVQLVLADTAVDAALASAAGSAGLLITDSAHLRRLHRLLQSTEPRTRQCVAVVVPSLRPAVLPGVGPGADVEAELEATLIAEIEAELEIAAGSV